MKRTGIAVLLTSLLLVACGDDLPDTGSLRPLDFTSGVSLGNDFSFSISPSGSLAVLIDGEPESGSQDCVTFRVVDLVEGTSVTSCPEASFTAHRMTSHAWLDDIVVIPRATVSSEARTWDPNHSCWNTQRVDHRLVGCSDCGSYEDAVIASRLIEPGLGHSGALARITVRPGGSGLELATQGGMSVAGDANQLMLVAIADGQIGPTRLLSAHSSVFEDIYVLRARFDTTGRYIAYTLHRKSKSLVPWPGGRKEVWLLDTRSEERRLLGSLQLTTNLMWSPDSSRLYVAGRESYGAPGRLWVYELGQVDGK